MGFLGSIGKVIGGIGGALLGGATGGLGGAVVGGLLGSSLFGGGSSLRGTPDTLSYQLPPVPNPSPQETDLLNRLYGISTKNADYGSQLSDVIKNAGLGFKAATNMQNLMSSSLVNDTLNRLSDIANGKLPEAYQQALTSTLKTATGNVLDEAAKRGVINSSITQGALSDALRKIYDMQVEYLPQVAQLTTQPYNFTYQTQVATPIAVENSLQDLMSGQLQLPANLYSQLLNTRYRIQALPIVNKGQPGLLSALMPGLGMGLTNYTSGLLNKLFPIG